MKSFSKNMWNQTEAVLRYSDSRRQELSDLIDSFSRRADVQQSYAKALESCSRSVDKHIRENSLASLTYSAFRFSSNNRAAQARNFAQQLRDQIVMVLKDTLAKQSAEGKQIQKDIKRLEKELGSLSEYASKSSRKYEQYFEESQDQLTKNEAAIITSATPKDKKAKLVSKTRELAKDIRQYEKVAEAAAADYNNYIERFHGEIEKNLNVLQEQETTRLDLQVDCIMKMLVFETSMVKNFEYDIANISQQMETGKSINDIQLFIEEHEETKQPLSPIEVRINCSIYRETVLWLSEGRLAEAVEFHKHKDVRQFIQKSFKRQDPLELKGFEDIRIEKFSTLASIVWKCWEGQDITGEEIAAFKELINDELNRQVVMMCLQCYHLANRLELSEKGFGHCTKMILTLFHKCMETQDVFVLRRIIDMSFYYFKKEPKQNKEEAAESLEASLARVHLDRHYLSRELEVLPAIPSREVWQALILLAVQEELYLLAQKPDLVQETQLVRQRTTILGQLASFCHHMIMLGLPVKLVRSIIGCFCRLYDIPEDQDRDLSRSIAAAVKKYKESKGSSSFHDIS